MITLQIYWAVKMDLRYFFFPTYIYEKYVRTQLKWIYASFLIFPNPSNAILIYKKSLGCDIHIHSFFNFSQQI